MINLKKPNIGSSSIASGMRVQLLLVLNMISADPGHVKAHQQSNDDDASSEQHNKICNETMKQMVHLHLSDLDSVVVFHLMQALLLLV